jgi:DNA-directed RNA polymerase specialized sigma24 family protein
VAGRKSELLTARRRARELRLKMEADRAERDRRIEKAATQVLVLHAELTRLREQADEVAAQAGTALRQLQAEGLSAEQAGSLCDLAVAEVRRLTRRATAWVVAKTAEPATT